jgi:hypothetical protein
MIIIKQKQKQKQKNNNNKNKNNKTKQKSINSSSFHPNIAQIGIAHLQECIRAHDPKCDAASCK